MWILALFWGCRAAPQPPHPFWDEYEKVVLGTGTRCTILALHGRGDSPDHFRGLYEGLPLDATVWIPRAPDEIRPRSFSWFAASSTVSPEVLGEQIAAQTDRIAAGLQNPPEPAHKLVVTGFSQGGMLSYAMAVRHPDQITSAIPIGGALPAPLWPSASTKVAPIHGFHGQIDQIVPLAPTEALVAELKTRGADATLKTYPNVAHTISREMRADYVNALKEACAP